MVMVSDSTISGNSANWGGGIKNENLRTLTLISSTISGNSRDGIENYGSLTVTNTTISGNSGEGSRIPAR